MEIIEGLMHPQDHFNDVKLDAYSMDSSSCFLDIGSGFGYPNFMVAATTGC
jgi:16S rRNA G527 N7-methylase RsmG